LVANILGLFSLKLFSACHRVEGSSRIVVNASSIQAGVQPVSTRDHRYFDVFPDYNGGVIIELKVNS
jgi:hypothetical protein